jgi:hypothetical protein
MLRDTEISNLLMTITASTHLAAAGQWADGYTCLLTGLQRAEHLAATNEPGAKDLVRILQRALENYTARYGLPLE